MFKKTVRGKNVRDGSADNAVFKRKVYFKKSVTKIAKFRNFENSKIHSWLPVSFLIIGLQGTNTLLLWFIVVNHQFYHKSESWIIEILRVNVDLYVER